MIRISTVYGLIPGGVELANGNIFSGVMKLVSLGVISLWWYSYLDAELLLGCTLFLVVIASHLYRKKYNKYWQSVKDEFFNDQKIITEKSPAQLASVAKPPSWWLPVINWNWTAILAIFASAYALVNTTQVSISSVVEGWPMAREFAGGLFNPDWSLLHEAVFVYARQTVEVALLGSAMGFVLALPISFLCAQNLMFNSPTGRVCYFICRSIMVVVRAIPTFLLGLIFVALVGLGPFPGVLAITVFSMGVMVKLFSEAIESVDNGMSEAVYSCGGNWFNMITFGVLPQVSPAIIAQLLYCVEINVHSATVLGLIGAEGIGLPIYEYLSALAYDKASIFIIITILMTVIIDYGSAFIRKRII